MKAKVKTTRSERASTPGRSARVAGSASVSRGSEAKRLMAEAELARRRSRAPYSDCRVGAALLTAGGRVIHGCNVENASYGLSMCAERNAVFKAVSEGEQKFVAVAVTAGPGRTASPCGACRQVLHELSAEIRVYWRDQSGRIMRRTLTRLLPYPFDLEPKRRQ